MTKKTELASKEELIDAAYRHFTKPWYKDLKQFISIVGTLAAIITSYTSLYISIQGQDKARLAVQAATELGHDLSAKAVETTQSLDDIFVYTATYFTGQRDAAIKDANSTQIKLDEAKIDMKATVYVREDNKRWAVVIDKPTSKDQAQNIINKLRKEAKLSAYPNPATKWRPENIQ